MRYPKTLLPQGYYTRTTAHEDKWTTVEVLNRHGRTEAIGVAARKSGEGDRPELAELIATGRAVKEFIAVQAKQARDRREDSYALSA